MTRKGEPLTKSVCNSGNCGTITKRQKNIVVTTKKILTKEFLYNQIRIIHWACITCSANFVIGDCL